jgi:ribosome-associated protein
MTEITVNILKKIAQIIYDKKGFNILALDIREISSFTDYFLIAEGNVDRHVHAMSNEIQQVLREEEGIKAYRVEGQSEGDWVVLDYVDFVIHLFNPELREKYRLEHLWSESKLVELDITVEEDMVHDDLK